MARIVLITGGSRSGKSEYALRLAESLPGPRVFIATCPAMDDEMRERIRRHRQARSRFHWQTIEEPADLVGALRNAGGLGVILVDCLTLWVNNLLHRAQQEDDEMTEEIITRLCGELIAVCRGRADATIFVTNEVGMGIVPSDALSRRFRDLAGRCNQVMASAADDVTLIACGLPLHLKKGSSP